MKALKAIGFFSAGMVALILSYLVYPAAYHHAWLRFMSFLGDEFTHQVAAAILLLAAVIMVISAIATLRRQELRRSNRSAGEISPPEGRRTSFGSP